eukprot:CAMPEP_0176415886 /NCGR_PEP_ID=MMETSP0127-20121128/6047_1 /TAXON_ID=938130 /ORGANISM="Platyophrya macrostoma, Strain WH" /LENGTH=316 /DNA_ID=CAMNT_0017795915 /DNA_START=54 /DNA_END=1004 /DNA_ORIENTATION=-
MSVHTASYSSSSAAAVQHQGAKPASSSATAAVNHHGAMVEVVTSYLQELMVSQNDPSSRNQHVVTITSGVDPVLMPPNPKFPSYEYFCAEREPAVSLKKYVERLVHYMRCTPECFIVALAYIRRVVDAGFPIHLRSVHRLILTATVVAAKTRDDHYYSMTYYAQVGGVVVSDLNTMELRFLLDVIDFKADVSLEEYRYICCDMNLALQSWRRRCQIQQLQATPASQPAVLTHMGALKSAVSGCSLASEEVQGMSASGSRVASPNDSRLASPQRCSHHHHYSKGIVGGMLLGHSIQQHQCHAMSVTPQWIHDCKIFW